MCREDRVEKAVSLLIEGYTCSESVVMAFASDFGLNRNLASKIAGCFAGGMTDGKTCGAVTGALMILGLKFGRGKEPYQNKKEKCFDITIDFFERFSQKNGSVECREILFMNNIDFDNPKDMKSLRNTGLCTNIVKDAAFIVEEILIDEGKRAELKA